MLKPVNVAEKINLVIFRAYDIRGKCPGEINESIVVKIVGKFLSRKFKIQNSKFKVIVGHDTRLSSPKLYRAAIKQLTTDNLQLTTIKAGLITTPMLYFLVNHFKADLGIMITASHNSKEYNGIKIVGKNAAPISGKEVCRVISNEP